MNHLQKMPPLSFVLLFQQLADAFRDGTHLAMASLPVDSPRLLFQRDGSLM
jgi:hypothetical protein